MTEGRLLRVRFIARDREQKSAFLNSFHVVKDSAIKYQTSATREIECPAVSMHPDMAKYSLNTNPTGIVVCGNAGVGLHPAQCHLEIRVLNQLLASDSGKRFWAVP